MPRTPARRLESQYWGSLCPLWVGASYFYAMGSSLALDEATLVVLVDDLHGCLGLVHLDARAEHKAPGRLRGRELRGQGGEVRCLHVGPVVSPASAREPKMHSAHEIRPQSMPLR